MSLGFEQLDDDSALLLYMAGELPTAQRLVVEQQLITDQQLRERLDRLRSSHDMLARSLEELDGAEPLPSSKSAERQLSRMMAQWQADRLRVATVAPAVERSRRMRWRTIPIAAAAALFVGFILWWDIQLTRTTNTDNQSIALNIEESESTELATVTDADELEPWVAESSLSDAERQLNIVAMLRTMNE